MFPEPVGELPDICGREDSIARAMAAQGPIFKPDGDIDFDRTRSAFSIALHMHQPLIPAGGADPATAAIIGNLQHMLEHPEVQDSHNAPVFIECYRRMGRFIPQLVNQGKRPRVMLDYSGCLLHGLRQMGRSDVLDDLRAITCDPAYRNCAEWLGSAWGHPVAPSTPVQDFRLHVRAWQHHFASIFGLEALARVRGFSPAEMALPNHPDVCYAFVRTLKDCGYRWLLVQEHTVERPSDAGPLRDPHIPHRLIARNSHGQTVAITAIIKTQGSDTKLVGQMQPYYEAKGLSRAALAGRSVPPLVTQIADGENGGVMMNEFPPKYHQVTDEASGTDTPAVNVTEYLEYLQRIGVVEEDFPPVQPVLQKQVWDRVADGSGPETLAGVIEDLKRQDGRFHMDGGSWTGNISWVRGYEGLLGPMESVSALFAERVTAAGVPATDARYRKALFHLLASQTSCFRYWGEGAWTEYGRELCRRAVAILQTDLAGPR
jgi:hypothetical protein